MVHQAVYYTHNNGGRPYKVVITGNHVEVYTEQEVEDVYDNLLTSYSCNRVFIGNSPYNEMTRFSGGYGPEFDGNSVLLQLSDYNYVFIGYKILNFTSLYPITEFISPVGNSDVPYPYAIDTEDNFYLLIENVIVKQVEDYTERILQCDDIYTYYYQAALITPDRGYVSPLQPVLPYFDNIDKWFVGDERYTMKYTPDPYSNYDRMTRDGEIMYVEDINGFRTELTKNMYISLMERFGERMGFQRLH